MPSPHGQCNVKVSTQYLTNERDEVVPVGVVVDFLDLPAEDLDDASSCMDTVTAILVPIMALAVNASFDDPKNVLIYDADEGSNEHPLRLNILEYGGDATRTGSRLLPANVALAALDGFMKHPRANRISRALISYNEALTHWAMGHELRAVLALWVALENLDRLAVDACLAAGETRDQLIASWDAILPVRKCKQCGYELSPYESDLEAAARRMIILGGDSATYNTANNVSNGYEHGYTDFPSMHRATKVCRDSLVAHTRRFVVDLLGLETEIREVLLTAPFASPQRVDGGDVFVMLKLIGPADRLAPDGEDHPIIQPEIRTDAVELFDDGGLDITITHRLNVRVGEGIETIGDGFGTSDRTSAATLKRLVVEQADGTVREIDIDKGT